MKMYHNLKVGNKKRIYEGLIRKIEKLNSSYTDVMSPEEITNVRKIEIRLQTNLNNGNT